jgi:hypothetical protein
MKFKINSIISIKGQPHIWQIVNISSPINVICRLVENTSEFGEDVNPRTSIMESEIESVLIFNAISEY